MADKLCFLGVLSLSQLLLWMLLPSPLSSTGSPKAAGWRWNGASWVWCSSSCCHWWWRDASSGNISCQNVCQVSQNTAPQREGFWSLPFLQSEQHLPKRICHILKFSSKLKTPYLLRLNKQFVRCCIIKRWHFEQPATNPQHRFPTIQEARLYFITLSYMFKLQIIIVYLNCLPWNWLTLRLLISETSKNSSVKTHLIKNLLNNNVFHLPFWQNVDIHRSR